MKQPKDCLNIEDIRTDKSVITPEDGDRALKILQDKIAR